VWSFVWTSIFFFLLLLPCGLFFLYLFFYSFIYKRKWDIKHGDPKETPKHSIVIWLGAKDGPGTQHVNTAWGWPRQPLKGNPCFVFWASARYPYYTCGGQKITSGPLGLAQWSVDLPINHQASKDLKVQTKVRTEHVCGLVINIKQWGLQKLGFKGPMDKSLVLRDQWTKVGFWGTNGQKFFQKPDNQPAS